MLLSQCSATTYNKWYDSLDVLIYVTSSSQRRILWKIHTEMDSTMKNQRQLSPCHMSSYIFPDINIKRRKMVKVTLVQALRLCTGRKAYRRNRGIARPFHDHGTRRGWGVSVTSRPLFTPEKDPVPIVQEAGWASGAENLGPNGIRSPDRPARSQWLYRLSYLAHTLILRWHFIIQTNKCKTHIVFTIEQASKAQRVSRGIALLFL